MTKKDYELIAGAIKRCDWDIDALRATKSDKLVMRDCLKAISLELAHRLANENPRFDREKFLTACGVKCECYDEEHTEQEIKHCICDCHINEQWFSESIKTAGDSKENWEKHIQGL